MGLGSFLLNNSQQGKHRCFLSSWTVSHECIFHTFLFCWVPTTTKNLDWNWLSVIGSLRFSFHVECWNELLFIRREFIPPRWAFTGCTPPWTQRAAYIVSSNGQ